MYIPKGKTKQTEDKNMTINEAMRTYGLPNPTTPEDLECFVSIKSVQLKLIRS